MSELLLEAKNIRKRYREDLEVLRGVSLQIHAGDSISIVGASGAGKSTLLHILGTLDNPNAGELFFQGESLLAKSEDDLAEFRNSQIGFVFQFHHLLAEFSAVENVMIPARLAGDTKQVAQEKAMELLKKLSLESRAEHFPQQLSGGELQRVAIARALIRCPKILFADEPTGNLDSVNGQKTQELFFQLKQEMGLTLVVVTHDAQFASKFSRQLRMKDGVWDTSI